ncbi:MAG: hypothetical protein LBQ43_01795 [Holosporales bacterium]|jgi:hypothetical protein|nr:hypothetical protein [Holosporales bacterium]
MQTGLIFSLGGLPPMSARGCTQELKAIPQGEFRRTVNGSLVFVGNPEHKYCSTIRCSDQTVIATEGFRVGEKITVSCIQHLCQKVDPHDNTIILRREVVPGSIYVMDENNKPYYDFEYKDGVVELTKSHGTLFVRYFPELAMRVTSFTLSIDEWKMKSGWTLELEEI